MGTAGVYMQIWQRWNGNRKWSEQKMKKISVSVKYRSAGYLQPLEQ